MGEKKEEDLYRNFSRKDLQGLCKKYGLPANKSSSEMATSLILYLEKKNISSKTICEVSRSDPYSSLWSELQPGVRMNSAVNKITDLREMSSHNGFGQFLKHGDPDKNDFQSRKASEDMGHLTQLRRDSNSGAGDVENTFSSVLSSTAEASLPTFTYNISCEDGIQLFVDLNSTTSDWIESLKAGVHICDDVHNLQPSTSDEKKGYFLMDSHNNPQFNDKSCPTRVGASVALQAEEFGVGSLSTPGPDSFENTVQNREELGEERAMLSSKSKHDTEQRNRGSECLVRKENEVVIHEFSGNTMAYDCKWSKAGDGMYTETCWQQTCNPPDPVLKSSRLSSTPFVGIETSPSINFLQRHDVASPSMVAPRLVLANQPQKSSILHFGPFTPGQLHRGVPQMWPVQAMDQKSPYASSSYLMSELSDGGHQLGIEHGRVSIPSKCSRLALEVQKQSVQSCENTRPYFPFQGLPLTNPNLDTNIIAANGGFISQEKVELPTKKDASIGPFSIDGPLHFAVPTKNHADHHVFNYSNNLDKDVDRGQVRSNLGSSKADNGTQNSGFNNFRQTTKEPRVQPTNSDYSEFRMKRHFSSADDQRQSESAEVKFLRTSNQFSGDARASRRRSMRPFSK